MNEPAATQRDGSRKVPVAIVLPLVIILAVIISILVFSLSGEDYSLPGLFRNRSESVSAVHTATPSRTPTSTSTRPRAATPTLTRAATATATNTSMPTPSATATATQVPTHTPTSTPTATPTKTATLPAPTPTPHAIVIDDVVRLRAGPRTRYDVLGYVRQGDALPVVGRTGNGKWLQVSVNGQLAWVLAELLEASEAADQVPVVRVKDLPPTPTPRPTKTPRVKRTRVPRPVLIEPRSGAKFSDKVRFKFSWFRRLQPDERVSLYVWTKDGSDYFDWWVSETDILNGGGAIHEQDDGVVYEVNSGFSSLPAGVAYWKVAVFLDTPDEKLQVSPWSRRRRIKIY